MPLALAAPPVPFLESSSNAIGGRIRGPASNPENRSAAVLFIRAERYGLLEWRRLGSVGTVVWVTVTGGVASGGGACSTGPDTEDQALLLGLLPVTTRGLPYLNTMHYIVRVISYISRLNKHRLNI